MGEEKPHDLSISMKEMTKKDEVRPKSNQFNEPENRYSNQYSETNRPWSGMIDLLCRWQHSVYQLIWNDILIFIIIYFFLSILYHHVLFYHPTHKQNFELICIYADRFSSSIPITFLIGFYVTQVVSRWWDQFMTLPHPDNLALKLVGFIPGRNLFHKHLRRAVMRYVNLSSVLALRLISVSVKKRFPDYKSLIDSKLLLECEAERLEKVDILTPHESSWTPLLWAMKLLAKAKEEKKITVEPPSFAQLQASFERIENTNRKLLRYGWINFPLSYTQVANLAVIMYFIAALFSRQFLIPDQDAHGTFPNSTIVYSPKPPFNKHTPHMYFPLFTIVEIICYMGWVKVAGSLLNPFGDDTDDFDINYLIDRNLQVSYLIVDQAEEDADLVSDPFLAAGIIIPSNLPYQEKNSKEDDEKVKKEEIKSYSSKTNEEEAVPLFNSKN